MNKQKVWYELRSFIMTFLAAFVVDGYTQITNLISGDFSRAAWTALLIAALKVAFKIIQTYLIPSVPTSLNSEITAPDGTVMKGTLGQPKEKTLKKKQQ